MKIDIKKTRVEPCRFCGNKTRFRFDTGNTGGRYSAVKCEECGASGPEVTAYYKFDKWAPWCDEALHYWNVKQ